MYVTLTSIDSVLVPRQSAESLIPSDNPNTRCFLLILDCIRKFR